ncbi:MAG: helix-turn-helix domain-containing protein [Candidatus Acidiferrales bacterium]
MASKILLVKEDGTHPPSEGILARFARTHTLRSMRDLAELENTDSDIVFVLGTMSRDKSQKLLESLSHARRKPLILWIAQRQQPRELLEQLSRLGALRTPKASRFNLARAIRLLGISQEALARMVGVSARTIHRWLKGARPRSSPRLQELESLIGSLEQTLDTPQAIQTYLHSSNPGLDGEKPIDLLLRRDFARVEDSLLAIREGVYV